MKTDNAAVMCALRGPDADDAYSAGALKRLFTSRIRRLVGCRYGNKRDYAIFLSNLKERANYDSDQALIELATEQYDNIKENGMGFGVDHFMKHIDDALRYMARSKEFTENRQEIKDLIIIANIVTGEDSLEDYLPKAAEDGGDLEL